jgi:hypothetical protein
MGKGGARNKRRKVIKEEVTSLRRREEGKKGKSTDGRTEK